MSRGVLILKNTGKVDVTFKVLINELKQQSLNISPIKVRNSNLFCFSLSLLKVYFCFRDFLKINNNVFL